MGGRGDSDTDGREVQGQAPCSFVVVLKPASGRVLISGATIGTTEIPIAAARALYDGLGEALAMPALARTMARRGRS